MIEAFGSIGGGSITYTREEFDATIWQEMKTSPLVLGHKRTRFAGFSSVGLGIVGTVAAFLVGSGPLFCVITAFSLLPAIFTAVQAFASKTWYDLDLTDPDEDTPEEVNSNYTKARNYMLLGGFGAIFVDIYAISTAFMSMDTAKAADSEEILAPQVEKDSE